MKPLDGKVAIVTGAGRPRGIGRAAALKLAEQGASVVVTDLARTRRDLIIEGSLGIGDDFAELEKLAQEIEAPGAKALPLAVDVTDLEQIEACVRQTIESFGRVDILFNNAGTAVGAGPFLDIPTDEWDLSFQVNVKGIVNFCRAVIPEMLKQGSGSIVNNASLAGLGALAEYGAYVMTKFAVVGLTKTIAAEFGAQNIRCNAVCPGIIATQMNDYQIQFTAEKMELSEEETKAAMAEPIAMKRFADAEEVADAVAYLAGPASGYITGVALPVAGGLPQGL